VLLSINNRVRLFACIFTIGFSLPVAAHPGRTEAAGAIGETLDYGVYVEGRGIQGRALRSSSPPAKEFASKAGFRRAYHEAGRISPLRARRRNTKARVRLPASTARCRGRAKRADRGEKRLRAARQSRRARTGPAPAPLHHQHFRCAMTALSTDVQITITRS
jgi:hypothetical protein